MRRLFACLALFAPAVASAQSSGLLDLIPDSTAAPILYASTPSRILRSEDSGRHWRALPPFPGGVVAALTATGSPTLLIARTSAGSYRSDDGGETWAPADAVGSVAASARDASILYAVSGARVTRSFDRARTWLSAGNGLPPIALVSFAVSPSDPRVAYVSMQEGTVGISDREGIWKTMDGGSTWFQTGFRPSPSSIHYAASLFVDPVSSDVVFAVSVACGFGCAFTTPVRSDDGGMTWRPTETVASAADSRGALFTTSRHSADHGMTWSPLEAGGTVRRLFTSSASVTIVAELESGALVASTDSGTTWFAIVSPEAQCAEPAVLCVGDAARFRVRVTFRGIDGGQGEARPVPLTGDAGAFWFFTPNNLELVVKVVSGVAVNGRWWIFVGSLTDVEYDLEVLDPVLATVWRHHNPAGTLASFADTESFPRAGGPPP